MKKILMLVCVIGCLLLVPVPVISANGGGVGWIQIKCNMNGASVNFDGEYKGTINSGSLKLNNIQSGDHTVALSLAGYQPFQASTSVTANTVSEISAILRPVGSLSGKGALTVSSNPSGANVFLDNNFVGISPLPLNDVAAGSHLVAFRLDRYQEYSITTPMNAGATSTDSAALSLSAFPTQKSAPVPVAVCIALIIIGIMSFRKIR